MNSSSRPLLALALLAMLCGGCGGGPPAATTDLFLIDLWDDGDSIRLGEPHNLTRRAGYDNQPAWSNDGRSVFYTSRSGSSADVYRYDLEPDKAERITRTEDKEYSPQPIPGDAGLTAVRLERSNSQRVWRYDADGQNPKPLLPALRDTVRYYAWIDGETVALRVGDFGSELHIADIPTGQIEHVVDDVGRSINRLPGRRAVSFVFKETAADWWIAVLDLDSREISRVARTLQGVEDHSWTPSGTCLMATDTRVFAFVPGRSDAWEEIADFVDSEMVGITRLAVSPDGSQLVAASEVRDR